MKRSAVALVVAVVAAAGCGGSGSGHGGEGGDCSARLPVQKLCELSCTPGARSAMTKVIETAYPAGASPTPGPMPFDGVTYQAIGLSCTNDGTSDSYDYDFWFLNGGLVHVYAQGTGKYAAGGSESRVTLPACISLCNSVPRE